MAHFLKQIENDIKGVPIGISTDALSLIIDYSWPGNVRQLQNVLQYSVVKCRDNLIHTGDLPMELLELQREKNRSMGGSLSEKNRRGPNRKLDLDAVAFALERSGNNKAKAARLLGVGRATLYRFLNDYPFAVPDGVRNS